MLHLLRSTRGLHRSLAAVNSSLSCVPGTSGAIISLVNPLSQVDGFGNVLSRGLRFMSTIEQSKPPVPPNAPPPISTAPSPTSLPSVKPRSLSGSNASASQSPNNALSKSLSQSQSAPQSAPPQAPQTPQTPQTPKSTPKSPTKPSRPRSPPPSTNHNTSSNYVLTASSLPYATNSEITSLITSLTSTKLSTKSGTAYSAKREVKHITNLRYKPSGLLVDLGGENHSFEVGEHR